MSSIFPHKTTDWDNQELTVGGLELRDYLAAKAMQGEISATISDRVDINYVAGFAYRMADAMLKQREVKND